MSTYVCLFNWTDEGIRNYRDTTHRAQDFAKMVENNGGRVRDMVWTVGEHDAVAIADFPDDESGMACLLQLGSLGNVRTRSLRAFSADEMSGIISRTR